MKRYEVTIEYNNKRKNKLITWAETAEEAKKITLKGWGNPTMYKSITVKDTKY